VALHGRSPAGIQTVSEDLLQLKICVLYKEKPTDYENSLAKSHVTVQAIKPFVNKRRRFSLHKFQGREF
jgi:hypothetical protein